MGILVQSPVALGRAIRDARRRKGLTQRQVADLAGIGQPTVSNAERGVTHVSLSTLVRILATLGLEMTLQERGVADPLDPWQKDS